MADIIIRIITGAYLVAMLPHFIRQTREVYRDLTDRSLYE